MNPPGRSTVITSRATTFFRLFSSRRFTVPWHQRRYDWKPDHVDELLHDFADAIKADRQCYFLGTVILVESGPGVWLINDGQQRMVTLSLISACLLRVFIDRNDSARVRTALRVLFDVEETSPGTADDIDRLSPRLTPPREDKTRYSLMIRGRSIGANGTLTLAWRQIDTFVAGMGREEATGFFDFLMQRVELSCLEIPPSVDANSVFETINSRGKRLEDLDLIRNHLYSYFNADDGNQRRDSVHENLESLRAQLRDDSQFTEYARCYFQSRFGYLRKRTFYRDTRRHIHIQVSHAAQPSSYVYDLVRDFALREKVELFRVVSTPSRGNHFVDEFARASGQSQVTRNLGMFLRELHSYKVTQPLVFALLWRYATETDDCRRRSVAKWVHARIKHLASFVLRTAFVAPKFEPSHFESEFSDLAVRVAAARDVHAVDVDACLRDCDSTYGIMEDGRFIARLSQLEMRDAKKVRRLLFGVNCDLEPAAALMSESGCTIEYILPKSPCHWPTWYGFQGANPEEWVYRLGNLALWGRRDSRPGDEENRDFSAKRAVYATSTVEVTRTIAACQGWTPGTVTRRQRKLAACAARVWSFDDGET